MVLTPKRLPGGEYSGEPQVPGDKRSGKSFINKANISTIFDKISMSFVIRRSCFVKEKLASIHTSGSTVFSLGPDRINHTVVIA